MKHDEFKISGKFTCGGKMWLCTDIGTRIITAIEINHLKDKSWQNGPPYALTETVFDENDFSGCTSFNG